MILAARWAEANGHEFSSYKLCGAICRMLLVLGPWLYNHGIALPLAGFLQKTVLVGGTWWEQRHDFWSYGYLEGVLTLGEVAQHVQAHFSSASKKPQIELRRKLIENGYGAELGRLVVQVAVNR